MEATTTKSQLHQKENQFYRKTALITGCTGCIGLAIVRSLLHEGYKVYGVDLRPNFENGLLNDPSLVPDVSVDSPNCYLFTSSTTTRHSQFYYVCLDITNESGVQELCEQTILQNGDLVTVLINNAGILSNNKIEQTSIEEWKHVLDVNVTGAFSLSHYLYPKMVDDGYGRIINITSMAAKTGGLTAGTSYSCSKGAMSSLTFSLARQGAGTNITVNGIAPAYVETPMVKDMLSEEERKKILEQIPVGRFCKPDEIAHTVNFLISPMAGFITGEIIDQNGGYHMD